MKKILLIEDDESITDLLEIILESAGYQITHSNNTLPFTDLIELNPDLILLDHYMDGGLGGDYCKRIKAHPQTEDIPVLILSAVSQLEQIAKDSCADGYIEKPFDLMCWH